MSAINVIRQTHQVHVLTDGAAYDPDGRLVMVGPKISIVPHLSCALAFRGPAATRCLLTEVLAHGAASYDGLRDTIAEMLRESAAIYAPLFDGCQLGPDFEVVVAGWSETKGADCYILPTHDRYGEAFSPVAIEGVTCLPSDEILQPEIEALLVGLVADDVDPEVQGLAIMEMQRAHPVVHLVDQLGDLTPRRSVGGFAQLTTIRPDGITSKILRRWPDVVGERLGLQVDGDTARPRDVAVGDAERAI
jgi:hypothetical protein